MASPRIGMDHFLRLLRLKLTDDRLTCALIDDFCASVLAIERVQPYHFFNVSLRYLRHPCTTIVIGRFFSVHSDFSSISGAFSGFSSRMSCIITNLCVSKAPRRMYEIDGPGHQRKGWAKTNRHRIDGSTQVVMFRRSGRALVLLERH